MLQKYNMSPLRILRNEVDRIFDQSLFDTNLTSNWIPEVDIVETEDQLVLSAECPGLTPDDIEVSVENNELTVRGEKRTESDSSEKNFHRIERRYGKFVRQFRLPTSVNTEEIKAEFVNGILRVTMAKKEETKARKIEVLGLETKPKELKAQAASG